MTGTDVLDNVAFARAHSTDEQFDLLRSGAAMLCDSRFAILIVDRHASCCTLPALSVVLQSIQMMVQHGGMYAVRLHCSALSTRAVGSFQIGKYSWAAFYDCCSVSLMSLVSLWCSRIR